MPEEPVCHQRLHHVQNRNPYPEAASQKEAVHAAYPEELVGREDVSWFHLQDWQEYSGNNQNWNLSKSSFAEIHLYW